MIRNLRFLLLLIFALIGGELKAQSAIGIFAGASDVGNVKHEGSSDYDSASDIYTLKGSGTNMWFGADEFHMVWKRIDGDFILYSNFELIGEGVDPHRKGGLIIRESLEPGSRYVSAAYHGDGLVSMQYRAEPDSMTQEIQAPAKSLSILQLQRSGDRISMQAADRGYALQDVAELELGFRESELYVGLFICSHNPDVVEEAVFTNVRLTIPAKPDFVPYRDYIGSRLEILDIETGRRKTIFQSSQPFEAPNWSHDGRFLVFNSGGLLYRISADGGKPEVIDTGFAKSNNNDHGFSPDGKLLAISHHAEGRPSGRNSVIYTVPAGGGTPTQVTEKSPSYWHGWSPDGKFLIYTANRNDQWDIYKIAVTGGAETQLTNTAFLDDGSEFSTDGKFIWFNSNRTGSMEIWRMNSDGTEQVQLTSDSYQNWFPHQSPDGKQLVFLSYPPEVDSADHPYYKHVMLRLMDVKGGVAKVIAHLYGGQGTINVPSWSPDSKKLAFVSDSDGLDAGEIMQNTK